MCDGLSWLPPLVRLEDYGGDVEVYLDAVYQYFREDFVDSQVWCLDRRVCINKTPIHDGKETTFWHIVSDGPMEAERIPNLRRCECVRWPRPIIDALSTADRIVWWKSFQDRRWRLKLALPDFSYVVVLADLPKRVFLITAFRVDRRQSRKKLWRECQQYCGTP